MRVKGREPQPNCGRSKPPQLPLIWSDGTKKFTFSVPNGGECLSLAARLCCVARGTGLQLRSRSGEPFVTSQGANLNLNCVFLAHTLKGRKMDFSLSPA